MNDLHIGSIRRGCLLVCYGDERPDTYADWLEPFVLNYQELSDAADTAGIILSCGTAEDFLDAIGIDLEREYFEQECCAGRFVTGWIAKGTIREKTAAAKRKLAELQSEIEAVGVQNLLDTVGELKMQLEYEKARSAKLEKETARLAQALKDEKDADGNKAAALSEFLSADFSSQEPVFYGPIAVVDSHAFILVEEGGVPLPCGDFRGLSDFLKRWSSLRVVELRETRTIPASPLGGTRVVQPACEDDWGNLWHMTGMFILKQEVMPVREEDRSVFEIYAERLGIGRRS